MFFAAGVTGSTLLPGGAQGGSYGGGASPGLSFYFTRFCTSLCADSAWVGDTRRAACCASLTCIPFCLQHEGSSHAVAFLPAGTCIPFWGCAGVQQPHAHLARPVGHHGPARRNQAVHWAFYQQGQVAAGQRARGQHLRRAPRARPEGVLQAGAQQLSQGRPLARAGGSWHSASRRGANRALCADRSARHLAQRAPGGPVGALEGSVDCWRLRNVRSLFLAR